MLNIPQLGYYRRKVNAVKKIVFTMTSAPSTFDITKATMRYDKEFAFSFRFDDGYLDAYTTAFPFFKGGDVLFNGGSVPNYAGLFYTDGCGNDVAFKAEIAINSGEVEEVVNPSARMNWTMVNAIYNQGWGVYNHGANELVSPAFDGLTQPQIDALIAVEIDEAESEIRTKTGVRVKNFTAPSNDNNYDPLTTARAISGDLKIVNNIRAPQRDALLSPFQYWYTTAGGRIDGIGADYDFINVTHAANLQQDATDLNFMATAIAGLSAGENVWFASGIHRCSYGDAETSDGVSLRFNEMRDFFERVNSTYGKTGTDIMWFAPQNEIYEYVFASELSVLSTVIEGNTVTVTCNFADVPTSFRTHALSLLIDSDVNITSVAFEGFDDGSDNIGYGGDNTTALVNASYSPSYETAVIQRGRAQVLVTEVESTKQQADFTIAQDFVNTLSIGSYRTALQVRLDAIVIVANSTIYSIDFGTNGGGRPTELPNWNNMTETEGLTAASTGLTAMITSTSSIGSLGLSISTAFAAVETNSSANVANVNNPFPFTALRDSWETDTNGFGVVVIDNLNPAKVYDFEFCSSRGSVHQDTMYTATGTNSAQCFHLTKNNGVGDVWETGTITVGIVPNGSNEISIRVEGSIGLVPNSNNRGYLGVIEITERNPA
jgi:hypothetical protein